MRLWFKKQIEIAQCLAFIFGVITAISLGLVHLTGGHIPPWVTVAEAQEQNSRAAVIQQNTAQILERLDKKIDGIGERVNQRDCVDLNKDYRQAQAAAAARPADPIARMFLANIRSQMRTVPGCAPDGD